jgi:TRAP-type uncharacterized transport system fused permease subunit
MFFIPIWVPNVLFLLSCVMSCYQLSQMNRENPFTTKQFGITIFSMVMVVTIVLFTRSHRDPWVSLAFALVAAGVFWYSIRQFRMLPPKKAFE